MPFHESDSNKNKHVEDWEPFGKQLKDFISNNRENLESESYDVILGFSRGGVILALSFACLLKDGNSKVYSKLSKASVRPIPRGFVIKTNDPCFIMNQAASKAEIDDITKNLKQDLEDFAKDCNNGKPINVLIMDDNLTGATRVKFLEDFVDDMKPFPVANRKTLAYVRHKAFLKEEIPTILGFPEDAEIFVMPWHEK